MTVHEATVLLWAEVMLLFSAANYLVCADPTREGLNGLAGSRTRWIAIVVTRSVGAAIATAWLNGFADWSLPLVVLGFSLVLPLLRARVSTRYCAELETSGVGLFVAASSALVFREQLVSAHSLPLPAGRVSAGCVVVALFLFVVRGGTYIVRGILDKCGTLPPIITPMQSVEGLAAVDCSEFNRGRLIGNLERILLVILAAFGNYEALGFLVAAKGLIRSKDLEDRNWAEYFLIGTLASVLVAVGVGLCVRAVLQKLW